MIPTGVRFVLESDLLSLFNDAVVAWIVCGVVMALLFLYASYVIQLDYSDVFSVADDGENDLLVHNCGGKQIYSAFDFDLCKHLMRSTATQERAVPPVLFANLFHRSHGTGICTSKGDKQELLKTMMEAMLNRSYRVVNACAAQTLEKMAKDAWFPRVLISLDKVESWVTTIMVAILFDGSTDCKIWDTDISDFEEDLDKLFEVREQLGKLVYNMNITNRLRRCIKHCVLLYKYNAAREVVAKKFGATWNFKLRSFAEWEFSRGQFTERDLVETYIEALLYSKKKLGYAVYKAIYEVAGNPVWRETVNTFISQPVYEHAPPIYINENTEDGRKMLGIIFEALRSSEQHFGCHLRRFTREKSLVVNSDYIKIPKGSICHIGNWSDKRSLPDEFLPQMWFDDHDFKNNFNQEVFAKFLPFGKGVRECPARDYSCNLIFCILAHVIRTGEIVLREGSSDDSTPYISFLRKPHFCGEGGDYMEQIREFCVGGRIP